MPQLTKIWFIKYLKPGQIITTTNWNIYFSSSTKEFHWTIPTVGHSAYVDSKVTVGMVLHSGLIKDDKSKYTKTILDFISFVDGIPDFLPKHY